MRESDNRSGLDDSVFVERNVRARRRVILPNTRGRRRGRQRSVALERRRSNDLHTWQKTATFVQVFQILSKNCD